MPKLNKTALRIRAKVKSKKPSFVRYESWRYKRLKKPWRRQKGLDNKARLKLKGWEVSPNVGFRGPRMARNLHPSGYKEVIVHNLKDLEGIDPKEYAVRVAHQVGTKKKMLILGKTDELGIRVLNPVSEIAPSISPTKQSEEKTEIKKEQTSEQKVEEKAKKETSKPKEAVKGKAKGTAKPEKKKTKKQKDEEKSK